MPNVESEPTAQPEPQPTLTRRQALGTLGVAAVGGGVAVAVAAVNSRSQAGPVPPSSTALLAADMPLQLARRASFGLTPGLLSEIVEQGPEEWLERQLDPGGIDDPEIDALLGAYPLLGKSAAQLQAALGEGGDRRLAVNQLVELTLARQIWSRRHLLEVMVDFWSNHFNVTTPLGPTFATKPVEDAAVIRRHALGTFDELLLADAQSPAMLIHLSNVDSRGDDPNENYGRELLELHTVGVEAGYTEDDVRDSAYVMTGWGVADDGTFAFSADAHYVGPLQVMSWSDGNSNPAEGLAVGMDYLRYLAHHQQTARHLSRKLAVRFVSDDPPDSLVDSLAASFRSGGTAIVPWLRTLFASPEFAASSGQKVRRPLEDVVASVRALGIGPPPADRTGGIAVLVERTRVLGQAPLGADPPTGYPDVASAWLSTSAVLGRWNVHRLLTSAYFDGLDYPSLVTLAEQVDPATMGELVDELCTALTGQAFQPVHRSALLTFLDADEAAPYDEASVTGSLPDLVALILDSPYHLLR
ncbi:MAG: DUF1800 domain-containing protein [Geodermatophilaceae bacterium]|nr:DUF1800 domain-containing protein [Geodermatophilaceae bacterium]